MGLPFKKKTFAILVAGVLLIVSSFFVLGILVNSDISKSYISNYISGKTRSKINIHDFTVRLLPVPGITLRHTRYDDKFCSIHFQSIVFVLKKNELLKGKILLDEVVINRPEIILRDRSDQKKTSQPFLFSPELKDRLFDSIFSYFPGNQDSIHVRVNKLMAAFIDNLDADLTLLKTERSLNVVFRVSGVSVRHQDLPDLVKSSIQLKSFNAKKMSGTVKVDDKNKVFIDTDLEHITLLDSQSKPLLETSLIQAGVYADGQTITAQIKPFQTQYPLLNAGVKLHLAMAGKDSYLQINGSDIDIAQAKIEALKLLGDYKTTRQLFQIVRGGTCSEIQIEFKSQDPKTIFHENNMHLVGNLKDGRIKIPETHLIASGVHGTARVEKGVLIILADKGRVAGSNILSGNLSIDLINYKDVPFNGQFLLDVDLSVLPKTLARLLPDTLLAQEMAMVGEVKGRTTATLNLNMETGKDLEIRVFSKNLSLTGQYERIPGEIKIDNVRFELDPGQLRLRHLTGTIDAGTFDQVDADIQLDESAYFNISSGSAVANLFPTFAWLRRYPSTRDMILPFVNGSGRLLINSIALSGPATVPDQWNYHLTGSASDIRLSDQIGSDQIKNIRLTFDLTQKDKTVENISFVSKDFNWLNSLVSQELTSQFRMPVTIQKGVIKTLDNSALIFADIYSEQDTMAGVSFSGLSIDQLSLKKLVLKDQEATDVVIEFSDQAAPPHIIDFSGKFNTQSYIKYLNPAGSWSDTIKKMTADQEMTIEKINGNQIHLKAKTLSLDPFLSNTDWVSRSSENKRNTPFNIDFEADRVTYRTLDLTRVKSRIKLEKEGVFVHIKEADLCGVNTNGDIRLRKGWIKAELPFSSGTREDIQPLLTCLIGLDKFMDGKYEFNGRLTSSSSFEDIKQNLNGTSSLKAENGRIYKLTLLSRILSVINVSKIFKGNIPDITQTGFSYEHIDIDARIENSIVYLDKAVIDGTDMTLLFTGTIDLAEDELNLNCLVAPFKTIDLIIKKIPIINTMLDGRLISVPVKASGKISDPAVIPLHPTSVGNGLINMMSDILKTPVRLIDKLTDDQDDEPR